MTVKRVVFLDVDGVCNSQGSTIAFRTTRVFDEVAVRLIERAADDLDLHFVLSSAWRCDDLRKCRAIFATRELHVIAERMIGYTDDGAGVRGDQIERWLDAQKCRPDYAIIDDDSDMLPHQMSRFVKTNWLTGFRYPEYAQLCGLFDSDHEAVRTMRSYREHERLRFDEAAA